MPEDTDTIIRLMHVAGENGRTLARYILDALEDEKRADGYQRTAPGGAAQARPARPGAHGD